MKQMIFMNTSVQPDRFCFVHLISVKQENWLRGWALSNLQTHQLPGFSCQLQTLDLTHFPKRNMKATPLWHVLSGRLHSTTCLSYGNPAASRQSPAAQWVPSADGLTSEDSHGVTKKEEQDYEWPPGIWDFRGHLQIFQRPDYLHVPSYRALSVQPSSTGSTQRETPSHEEQLPQISWTAGPQNLRCRIKHEISSAAWEVCFNTSYDE